LVELEGAWLGKSVVIARCDDRTERGCGRNSVVHNVPDFCVATGVPAEIILTSGTRLILKARSVVSLFRRWGPAFALKLQPVSAWTGILRSL
jgi:hypothetical protein